MRQISNKQETEKQKKKASRYYGWCRHVQCEELLQHPTQRDILTATALSLKLFFRLAPQSLDQTIIDELSYSDDELLSAMSKIVPSVLEPDSYGSMILEQVVYGKSNQERIAQLKASVCKHRPTVASALGW